MEVGAKLSTQNGTSNYILMFLMALGYALQVHFDPNGRVIAPLILRAWTWCSMWGFMWLHMDIIHVIESLVTLWVFGRYVARRLSPTNYIALYMLMGAASGTTHLMFDGRPTIGASGAIMGVLGVHVVLCYLKFGVLEPFLIALWFAISLGFGIGGLGPAAHMAHVGGFVVGIVSGALLLVLGIDDGSQAHPAIARMCQHTPFRHAALVG